MEIQIDELDSLGREIENYFLAWDVVSRTIDILFTKPEITCILFVSNSNQLSLITHAHSVFIYSITIIF